MSVTVHDSYSTEADFSAAVLMEMNACKVCPDYVRQGGPPHFASIQCESGGRKKIPGDAGGVIVGKRTHCSCDWCF